MRPFRAARAARAHPHAAPTPCVARRLTQLSRTSSIYASRRYASHLLSAVDVASGARSNTHAHILSFLRPPFHGKARSPRHIYGKPSTSPSPFPLFSSPTVCWSSIPSLSRTPTRPRLIDASPYLVTMPISSPRLSHHAPFFVTLLPAAFSSQTRAVGRAPHRDLVWRARPPARPPQAPHPGRGPLCCRAGAAQATRRGGGRLESRATRATACAGVAAALAGAGRRAGRGRADAEGVLGVGRRGVYPRVSLTPAALPWPPNGLRR